jgi:streptogramin lyase
MTRVGRALAASLLASTLADCSGGGSAPNAPSPTTVAGSVELHFPASSPAASTSASNVRRQFLSPSTASVSIAISGVTAPVIANVAANSPDCAAAANGRTCTIAISAPPGTAVTFTVTLYDGPNATGKKLGTGTATQAIATGAPFTVAIGVTGIAGSVLITAAQVAFIPGTASTTTVTVVVKDADGNTIAGTYASAIALTTNDTTGAFTFSPTSVTSSAQAITLKYDGAFLATPTVTLSASASGVPSSSITPQQLAVSLIGEYPLPAGTGPSFMSVGPDGDLYFATASGVGRFNRTTLAFTALPVPSGGGSGVSRTAPGPDGNEYFTEFETSNIGSVTPAGVVTEYTAPTGFSQNTGITTGPDGNIWFSEARANNIARFTIPGHVFTEFPIPTGGSNPIGIVTGPDGALWFSEFYQAKIGRITTAGAFTEYPLSANAGPNMICVGADGNLWFTETNLGKIGRITPAGVYTEFTLPSGADSLPIQINPGQDGNVWWVEANTSNIGRITPDGVITEFPMPTPANNPDGIVAAPDGDMYATEVAASKIARFNPRNP